MTPNINYPNVPGIQNPISENLNAAGYSLLNVNTVGGGEDESIRISDAASDHYIDINHASGITLNGSTTITGGSVEITSSGSPSSIIINSITWPVADGTSGQALVTDGAGNLSFETISGGGLTNPLTADLDVANNSLLNVGQIYGLTGDNISIRNSDNSAAFYVNADQKMIANCTDFKFNCSGGLYFNVDSNKYTVAGSPDDGKALTYDYGTDSLIWSTAGGGSGLPYGGIVASTTATLDANKHYNVGTGATIYFPTGVEGDVIELMVMTADSSTTVSGAGSLIYTNTGAGPLTTIDTTGYYYCVADDAGNWYISSTQPAGLTNPMTVDLDLGTNKLVNVSGIEYSSNLNFNVSGSIFYNSTEFLQPTSGDDGKVLTYDYATDNMIWSTSGGGSSTWVADVNADGFNLLNPYMISTSGNLYIESGETHVNAGGNLYFHSNTTNSGGSIYFNTTEFVAPTSGDDTKVLTYDYATDNMIWSSAGGGGVSNPMVADLDADNNSITNVNILSFDAGSSLTQEYLKDTSGYIAVSYLGRGLVANDGMTATVLWQDCELRDTSNNIVINWSSGLKLDANNIGFFGSTPQTRTSFTSGGGATTSLTAVSGTGDDTNVNAIKAAYEDLATKYNSLITYLQYIGLCG